MDEVVVKLEIRRVSEVQSEGQSNVLGPHEQTQLAGPRTGSTAEDAPFAAAAPPLTAPRLAVSHVLVPATVPRHRKSLWVPPGVPVDVAGLIIPGGMLYVGPLRAGKGGVTHPALIDPELRIDLERPDSSDAALGNWNSYGSLTPPARAAYLTWLADGRCEPEAPYAFLMLFFYGLERRVIVDATRSRPARDELPLIRAEVIRLLDIYGGGHSFRSHAITFLDLIDIHSNGADAMTPPERTKERWPIPMRLRAALDEFASEGIPVPVEWALVWIHFHSAIYPGWPITHCPEEFEALFRIRYASRYGAGLTLTVGGSESVLTPSYRSASGRIGKTVLSTGLPDVYNQAAPIKQLTALVEDCTSALDAYARYLAGHRRARTLAAAALLPPELVADFSGGLLHRFSGFIDHQLGDAKQVLIEGTDLIAFFDTKTLGQLNKAQALELAELLGARGVGLEPDVRLGGPVLVAGPAVLFRTLPAQPTAPSLAYSAAAILLHFAAAVSVADGHASDAETMRLRDHIETAMHLMVPERLRLHAHLTWLLAGQTKLTGLTKRLDLLDDAQRDAIGDFLTMVAAADGVVSPAEITTLTKIFKLLRLDPASVYSRLHAAATGGLPANGPVTVRRQSPGAPGYAVPPRPASGTSHLQVVRLNEALILAKLAETAAVSALLGSIFIDDDQAPSPPPPAANMPLAGLDGPHSALLRALAARASWSRRELEAECAGLSQLPDGALDTLNEAAYDAVGDPFADGDDPIDINRDVAQEMLA